MGTLRTIGLIAAAGGLLAACATEPSRPSGAQATRGQGTMRAYQVGGVWYQPREQPGYDEVGLASWYGGSYLNRTTADGEVFDGARASAAHKTLPLPSLAEVTNLDNGRRIQVRINDRGPFVSGRIIDLSPKAAQELGFYEKGSARVRVRYLAADTGRTVAISPLPRPVAGERAPPITIRPAFAVQAGAFSDRANAERAASTLQAQGPARIESVLRGDVTFYRVLVSGPAGADAQTLTARVVAAGFPEAKVVGAF